MCPRLANTPPKAYVIQQFYLAAAQRQRQTVISPGRDRARWMLILRHADHVIDAGHLPWRTAGMFNDCANARRMR
jgi:hypothetical protein